MPFDEEELGPHHECEAEIDLLKAVGETAYRYSMVYGSFNPSARDKGNAFDAMCRALTKAGYGEGD